MKRPVISTETASAWMDGNIIYYAYKSKEISLPLAVQSVELKKQLAQGKEYPICIDLSQVKSVTKEARQYLSGGQSIENITVAALLASSVVSKLICTFFLNFNKPPVMVKIFVHKDEAVKWLNKFL